MATKNPLALAASLYPAFESIKTKKDLSAAMADWEEMEPAEQQLIQTHLAWLNLQALAHVARGLRDLRDAFDEFTEALAEASHAEEASFDDVPSGGAPADASALQGDDDLELDPETEEEQAPDAGEEGE